MVPSPRAGAAENEGEGESPGDPEVPQEADGRRLRPGYPAPGSRRTTTAPRHAPDGRPRCPSLVTLCRGGGGGEVSVVSAKKKENP